MWNVSVRKLIIYSIIELQPCWKFHPNEIEKHRDLQDIQDKVLLDKNIKSINCEFSI